MADVVQSASGAGFRSPKKAFRGVEAEAIAAAVAAASEIALVLGKGGTIEDVSSDADALNPEDVQQLIGQRWGDTVADESRAKVELAIKTATKDGQAGWFEINQNVPGHGEVPTRYYVVRLGDGNRCVAMGRDLRDTVSLQRRLVQAQQEMEREYSRVRQAETRYRLLFQYSSEPVVIADAQTMRVREMNPAAQNVLRIDPSRLEGKPLQVGFAEEAGSEITTLFATARAAGVAEATGLKLSRSDAAVDVVATLFSFGRASHMLIKLIGEDGAAFRLPRHAQLAKLVDSAPEAFVVTDTAGVILAANPAFLEIAQVPTRDAVEGHALDRWIGRPGAEFASAEMLIKQEGGIRFFETSARGNLGDVVEVEMSGVMVADAVPQCMGFVIRSTGGRLKGDVAVRSALPEAVEQMRDLVGRVPLKDLVRETTDIIERMCIEAALEITNDNRASAAEILGLSRQSLYVKLRRYGLDDQSGETDDA
jgi:transcriptional regulator PpsR